jgi:hypothetical protein
MTEWMEQAAEFNTEKKKLYRYLFSASYENIYQAYCLLPCEYLLLCTQKWNQLALPKHWKM